MLPSQQKNTGYLDARPDVEAAIEYVYKKNKNKQIIFLGSSYTAALALLIGDHPLVKAKILFSPDEHLKGLSLQKEIADMKTVVFATSSKPEIPGVTKLFKLVDKKILTHYNQKKKDSMDQRSCGRLWKVLKINGSKSRSFWSTHTDCSKNF